MRGLLLLFTISLLFVGLGDTRSIKEGVSDLTDKLNKEIQLKNRNKKSYFNVLKHDFDNAYEENILFNQENLSDEYETEGEYSKYNDVKDKYRLETESEELILKEDNQEEETFQNKGDNLSWIWIETDSDQNFSKRKVDGNNLRIENGNSDDIFNGNEEYNNEKYILNKDEVDQSYQDSEDDRFGVMDYFSILKGNYDDDSERRRNEYYTFYKDYTNENGIDNKDSAEQSYQNNDDSEEDEYNLYENKKDGNGNYINKKYKVNQYYQKNDDESGVKEYAVYENDIDKKDEADQPYGYNNGDSEEVEYALYKDEEDINENGIDKEDEIEQSYKNNVSDSEEEEFEEFYQNNDDDRFGIMDYIENRKVKYENNDNDQGLHGQIDSDFADMDYSPEDYVSKYND